MFGDDDDWFGADFISNKSKLKKLKMPSLGTLDIKTYEKDMLKKIASVSASNGNWGTTATSIGAVTKADVDARSDDTVIKGKLTVDGEDVGEFMRTMKDRFLILEDDFKKHEQYPALKDAYDKYKLIERLLHQDKGE